MVFPRIITAVFFVPIVLAAAWTGGLPFFIFVLGICLLSYWEYSLMADGGGYPNQLLIGLLGSLVIVLAFYLDGAPIFGPLRKSPSVLFVFLMWTLLSFLREFIRGDKSVSLLRVITSISGVVISALLLGHLVLIRDLRVAAGEGYKFIGREMCFLLIFIIWTVDTGAWFVGKLIGRFPLAPQISPKKTWVGSIGGTVLACVVGWIYCSAFLKSELSSTESIAITLIVAIVAQISDLIESLMKRSFGAKDSSQLLPGHGGILDRFDSFIFAAPVFYYLLLGTGRFQ